jgi:hypothetical protein
VEAEVKRKIPRMGKNTICLLGMTLLVGQAFAQGTPKPTDATAQTVATAKASADVAKDAVYRNDGGELAFFYPSDLVLGDANAVADRGHRAIYGNEPESDPEHTKSEKCMHFLMMADLPEAASPTTLTLGESGKSPVQIVPSPSGSILLAEIDRTCLPKKMSSKDTNDALGNMASIAQKMPGMTPIDQQMWYEVDKHKVHFSAAHGRLSSNPQGGRKIESAEEQAVATLSVENNGHYVMWMIMSNDLATFNRLLASKVQFGGGPVVLLYPFTIGNGPPMKLVP